VRRARGYALPVVGDHVFMFRSGGDLIVSDAVGGVYVVPDHEHASLASPGNLLWDDLRVSLSTAKVAGNDVPTWSTFRDGVKAHAFSASSMNELFFEVQLPHGWSAGSEVRPHVHWSPGNSTSTNTVRWGLEYTWASAEAAPGNTFPATTTLYVDDAAHGAAYSHQIAQFAGVAGTGQRVSSVLVCRLFRDAANGADTFATDAFALSVDFHIQMAGDGSAVEYPTP
jgi:phage baseplate assembly protein gpV